MHPRRQSMRRPGPATRVALLLGILVFCGFKLRDPINPANDKRPDQFGPYRHWDLREF